MPVEFRKVLALGALCGSFALGGVLPAQTPSLEPGGHLYRAALDNFVVLSAAYSCPPARSTPFQGSGFVTGIIRDHIVIATASHVVFPQASKLVSMPATPSCKYELRVTIGSATADFSQESVVEFLVTPPKTLDRFRDRFLATSDQVGSADFALLVIPYASFQPQPNLRTIPVLCPYEEMGEFHLYAFTTGSGAALSFSPATGPLEPPPGGAPDIARWKLADLVREGTSGSPLLALIDSGSCGESLALVGVIRSRASSTAAGQSVEETNYFDVATPFAIDQPQLSGSDVLHDWGIVKVRNFDSQMRDLAGSLISRTEAPAGLVESVRQQGVEISKMGCFCERTFRRWEGFLGVLAESGRQPELGRQAVREIVAQVVLDASRGTTGSLYSQWSEVAPFLPDAPALPARFASATEALTDRVEAVSAGTLSVDSAADRVLVSVCAGQGSCSEQPLERVAGKELKKLDAFDPGLASMVLDRLKDDLPPGGGKGGYVP